MKALLATGTEIEWVKPLGDRAWALLPVDGRPMIETWLECCAVWGIEEVRVLLGRHAFEVEQFCGDGARWGLEIEYSFLQSGRPFLHFLQRNPEEWKDGVLVFHGPTHLEIDDLPKLPTGPGAFLGQYIEIVRGGNLVSRWLERGRIDSQSMATLKERPLRSLSQYYELNQLMVRGELRSPVRPGYDQIEGEGAIGRQVVLSPSCEFEPPVVVGNACRIGAFASIGPDTLLGDGVIVGRGSRVARSLVLERTYIGDGLDIEGRIVSGNRLVDPEDGTWIPLDELLLGDLDAQKSLSTVMGEAVDRALALFLLLALGLPHLFGRIFHRFEKTEVFGLEGRRFHAAEFQGTRDKPTVFERLSLDRVPALLDVLRGRLRLAGHLPLHVSWGEDLHREARGGRPSAFGIHETSDPVQTSFDVHFARSDRGLGFTLRTLGRWLLARLKGRRP